MSDVKGIRKKLWHSLDMLYVKKHLILAAVCAVPGPLVAFIAKGDLLTIEEAAIALLIMSIPIVPILIFCIWQTVRIFRCAESYRFSKTTLINPKGGTLRDTIQFGMVLEKADGKTIVVNTRSIFSTHSGAFRANFEHYVNQTVTAAYNEATGNVVVIG